MPLRFINALVSTWDRLTGSRTFALTPDLALAMATKKAKTALADPSSVLTPLALLCELTSDRNLTPLGRLTLRMEIMTRLTNRLTIEALLSAHPDIATKDVGDPWFIVGLPRTGTTFLHRLLAQDPSLRAPVGWETIIPALPRPTGGPPDPRIWQLEQVLRFMDYIAPDSKVIHETGATLPVECLGFLANTLVSEAFTIGQHAPAYRSWQANSDLSGVYALHRAQLQILGYKRPHRTWVLKSPAHLRALRWLVGEYPAARIIQLHRAPVEVVPSISSLVASVRSVRLRRIEYETLGQEVLENLVEMVESGMAARDAIAAQPDSRVQFIDVLYSDLVRDPMGTVRAIFRSFGHEPTEEAVSRMEAYVRENRQHKFGPHHYSLGQFGLEGAAVNRKFEAYAARYLNTN